MSIQSQPPLILASSSTIRKRVLAKIGIEFTAIAPNIDESPLPEEAPEALVQRLSEEKARKVAHQYSNHLVIGSDQVAVVNNEIVGKPSNRAQAIKQLEAASGRTVSLYTGVALLNSGTGRIQVDVLPYRVQFRKLTRAVIENYIDRDQPYDCGGSLRSEGLGIALLSKFEGEDPNILLGLPLIRLIDMLAEESVFPL